MIRVFSLPSKRTGVARRALYESMRGPSNRYQSAQFTAHAFIAWVQTRCKDAGKHRAKSLRAGIVMSLLKNWNTVASLNRTFTDLYRRLGYDAGFYFAVG